MLNWEFNPQLVTLALSARVEAELILLNSPSVSVTRLLTATEQVETALLNAQRESVTSFRQETTHSKHQTKGGITPEMI
jgi:hypothetical protein